MLGAPAPRCPQQRSESHVGGSGCVLCTFSFPQPSQISSNLLAKGFFGSLVCWLFLRTLESRHSALLGPLQALCFGTCGLAVIDTAQTCQTSPPPCLFFFFVVTALLLLSRTVVPSAPEPLFEITPLLSSLQILFPNMLVLVLAPGACKNKEMPLILSKEQVSRRQLGGWLLAEFADCGFSSPLRRVLSPGAALWMLLNTGIGEHVSLPGTRAVSGLLLMESCAWRQIVPAESKFLFCLFWKKQLVLVVSRCISWTVKDEDHKRLNITTECFHFLNFDLSTCICQMWSWCSTCSLEKTFCSQMQEVF